MAINYELEFYSKLRASWQISQCAIEFSSHLVQWAPWCIWRVKDGKSFDPRRSVGLALVDAFHSL